MYWSLRVIIFLISSRKLVKLIENDKLINLIWSNCFDWVKMLWRYVIEQYSSKSIDDKRLISIKSNLIYWSEYWLFDALQLMNIEIYLYSTIYEMNNFDVELDSYLCRFHVVRWISRDETLRESFNKIFVLRSFAHFMIRSLKIWAWFVESTNSIDWRFTKIVMLACLIWEKRSDD
jgi:hypothetical protein